MRLMVDWCNANRNLKEMSKKVKLSFYHSFYVPALNYGHEVWVMTKRMRLQIQGDEMSCLYKWPGSDIKIGNRV